MARRVDKVGGEELRLKEMLEIARMHGLTISKRTIADGCKQGAIEGARKMSFSGLAKTEGGGNWVVPRRKYFSWLMRYKRKKAEVK